MRRWYEEMILRGLAMRGVHFALVTGMMLVAATTGTAMSPDTTARTAGGEASFPWRSVTEALTEAPAMQKLILLDVYTDWCGWCKRMDRDTYADSTVGSYIAQRFVAAKMNPEKAGSLTFQGKEISQGEFAQSLGINGYPATAFITSDMEVIGVAPGYWPAEDFHLLLRYMAEGFHKTTEWEEFRAQNGKK
jgi:thioredoxin-related protein